MRYFFTCLFVMLVFFGQQVQAQSTMSQSLNSTIITAGNSVGCTDANGYHADNSWWRSYDIAAELIANQPGATSIDITSITYGVELAQAGVGSSQPIDIRLYIDPAPGVNPAFQTPSQLLLLHSESTIVGNTTTGAVVLTQPLSQSVSVYATERLVVELHVPDGIAASSTFWPGSNNLGETGPTYISSPQCGGLALPVPLSAIGFPNMNLILDVNYLPSNFNGPGTHPASAEANVDLALLSSVNQGLPTTGIGSDVKSVSTFDVVSLQIISPVGSLSNREIALVAEVFNTGSPPSPTAHPDVAVSLAGAQVVLGFTTTVFGPPLLPPGGLTLNFVVPSATIVPPGISVIFQAISPDTTGVASNGFFVSSTAHEFQR